MQQQEPAQAVVLSDVHVCYRTMKTVPLKRVRVIKRSQLVNFEALRGVSFAVNEGESVGLVGRNGSGKSTLLKAVAGIFSPNKGTIDLGGRSVSLLALGVGFQPKLSGRDNVVLSGLLMGLSKDHILQRMDSIIAFAGLEQQIDMPVQSYSSGMYSKLAFAITANIETDIILVDEVFSVGDAGFRKKSAERMRELIRDEKRTSLIVSHSEDTIRKMCSRVVWIDQGQVMGVGTPEELLPEYARFQQLENEKEGQA